MNIPKNIEFNMQVKFMIFIETVWTGIIKLILKTD